MKHLHPPYDLPEEILDLLRIDNPGIIPEIADVWHMVGTDAPVADSSRKERVRAQVLASIQASSSPAPPPVLRRRSERSPLRLAFSRMSLQATAHSVVAACLALLVVASFVMSPDIVTVRVPSGTLVSQVTLPDGSIASLSAGSLLSFPESFDSTTRRVTLHGAAFLDVEPSSVPFEVVTFDAVTRVLGTSFSVEAWPSNIEAASRVVVATGKVEVRSREQASILTPGQALRISSNTIETDVNVPLVTSWRTGGLSYSNELVGNVLADLERRYAIQLEAPASIRLRRISIQKRQASDVAEVIGDISATVGIRYRAIQGGYELYLQ
ncbi:MAG: FecR domain-containing protein [Rhodothermales bacterium]